MIEIKDKKECCGCTACQFICPTQAISMQTDNEGFKYPQVNSEKCIHCSACVKVCKFNSSIERKSDPFLDILSVSAIDEKIVNKSTSGGLCTILSKYFFDNNYQCYGVILDDKLEVKHILAKSMEDIIAFSGSKYVQSDLGDTFNNIKNDLKLGKKVAFFGTGCQILGLKSYLKTNTENLVTIEILCHGVASPKVFKKYVEYTENKFKKKINNIYFRSKDLYGWTPPTLKILFKKGKDRKEVLPFSSFGKGFGTGLFNRPSCAECPITVYSQLADFLVCDHWNNAEAMSENKGKTLVFVNTIVGQEILSLVSKQIVVKPANLEEAIKGNKKLIQPTCENENRKLFFSKLNNLSYEELIKVYDLYEPLTTKVKFYIRKKLLKR